MGEKPSVDHLRIFGCHSFVHIPKDERKKLDFKSKKCVFLGYGSTSKGYRLYDPVKKKVILSRDVIFNEFKFGLESADLQPESQKYVCIEYPDDSQEPENTTVEETPAVSEDGDISPVVDGSPMTPVRQSQRDSRKPDRYGFPCNLASVQEPESVKSALSQQVWKDAMKAEMDSLGNNDV